MLMSRTNIFCLNSSENPFLQISRRDLQFFLLLLLVDASFMTHGLRRKLMCLIESRVVVQQISALIIFVAAHPELSSHLPILRRS